MPRMRYTINNMPLRSGLTTAGQQGTIPETALWQAKNCVSGLDALLAKRPGLSQWGQQLRLPNSSDSLSYYEMFSSLTGWSNDEAVSEINVSASDGTMKVSVSADSTVDPARATNIVGRQVSGSEGDSDDADWSVRFTVQPSNVPDEAEFIVSCTGRVADAPYAFKITGTDVQYYATGGTWTSWYSLALTDVATATYEFRVDADGDATLYVDDTLVGTQAVSTMDTYTAMSEGVYTEFHFSTNDALTQQYTLYITDLMMEGTVSDVDSDGETIGPFTAKRLSTGIDFKSIVGGAAVRRSLLVASDKHIYRDSDLRNMWAPMMVLTGGFVTFSDFGDDLLIFDADGAFGSDVYRWNGSDAPEPLRDAPNVRFGSEHKTRLLAAGDKEFPLRLYYTASRSPNVWFAPETDADGQETEDEVRDAGYLQVPGKRGDEILSVTGEYYGSAIVTTNRGIWRLVGSGPLSYAFENVSQTTGGSAQAGVASVANDIWIAGRQGISTLQTVQQFGDMQAAMPSAPISDLWSPGISNSSIKVDQYQLYKTSLAWNPTLSLLYFAFARQGSSDVSSIYTYNPVSQSWHGPWDSDTTFVQDIELSNPITQVIMHGTSTGKVGITDPNYKADFDSNYTMTIESPYLCGRSVDPSLTNQTKTWCSLRLYVQVRGAWNLNVKWQVDDETYQTSVEDQNVFNLPVMGQDWRLDVDPDGRLHSNQLIGVIEIPVDASGRYFKFEVSTEDAILGEDLVLQGYEVEFTASGPDQEQE